MKAGGIVSIPDWKDDRNLAMLTDFYELTMGNGYLANGMASTRAYFDLFYRHNPDDGGFAVFAGLEQFLSYVKNLSFSEDDIDYLRSRGIFSDGFLDYLRQLKFEGDIWAVAEGTAVFPSEPLVVVRAPIIQAQLIETALLTTLNHQTLIATKANRIVRAAQGRPVVEFGARRAHSYDASILGARAAYIGGCAGTSCTLAGEMFGIPALGTMAHSWVQSFPTEFDAFRAYAQTYPDACLLLIDTYDVLNSGIVNAIRTAKEVLEPRGYSLKGVRIDSGDLAYLSKRVRRTLDRAGLTDCQVMASNSLDEYTIASLLGQGAPLDQFGVGERLITSQSDPVLGGVYKLAAVEQDGKVVPKIKVSDDVEKTTVPSFKQVHRLYDRETHKAIADLVTLFDEVIDESKPLEIFDPRDTWKRKVVTDFEARPLLKLVCDAGTVLPIPTLEQARENCRTSVEEIWDEVKRFEKPHAYYVDLSQKLWDLRDQMIKSYSKAR